MVTDDCTGIYPVPVAMSARALDSTVGISGCRLNRSVFYQRKNWRLSLHNVFNQNRRRLKGLADWP